MQSFRNTASFWLNNFRYIDGGDVQVRAMTRRARLRATSEAQRRDCLLINVLLACALHIEGDVSKTCSSMKPFLFDYRAVRAVSQHGPYGCREVMHTLHQNFQSMRPRQGRKEHNDAIEMGVLNAYDHTRSVCDYQIFEISFGSFGLSPSAMRLGDLVVIIGGANHPVVLRPHGEHCFLVVNAPVSGRRDWKHERADV